MTDLDPDKACEHPDFRTDVSIARLTAVDDGPVVGYSAEVMIECGSCGESFVFVGLPMGLDPRRPTTDVTGTRLRAPLRPQTSTAELDPGLPGFTIEPKE